MIADTNTFLLNALREVGNERIWAEFCARYIPVLTAFARRLGLTNEDAQDAAQDTLLAFADAYRQGSYDRQKARLRTWLFAIAKNKIRHIRRRNQRGHGFEPDNKTHFFETVADDDEMSALWDAEWQRSVVAACLEQVAALVEPATLKAFELFVLKEWPADRVAAEVGISRNAVFKAKRRILSRMREVYRQIEADG